jgi:hypothetical protein
MFMEIFVVAASSMAKFSKFKEDFQVLPHKANPTGPLYFCSCSLCAFDLIALSPALIWCSWVVLLTRQGYNATFSS